MLDTFLTPVVAVLVVLGIMMFVHEWGHFIAARFFGIRVEIFSFFGMGPRVWGFKRGDTDYRLSLLPIGAYVKMAGEDFGGELTGAPDEFPSKPKWQRTIVLLAGPAMNIITAIVLLTGLFVVGIPQFAYFDEPAVIAWVPKDSIAEKAGILSGDRVAEVNAIKNPTWEQAYFEVLVAAGRDVQLVVDRKGNQLPVSVPTTSVKRQDDALGLLGYPALPVIVGRLSPGMPADKSGIRTGDRILEMDGVPLFTQEQFRRRLQATGGRPSELVVERGGQQMKVQVRPIYGETGSGMRYQIGIVFHIESKLKPLGPAEAFSRSLEYNARFATQILWVVGQLVQGKVSLKQLQGPVGIAREAAQAVRQGPHEFVLLMALIGMNLGVLNLLPIPILDGGHILLLMIEGTMRRELSAVVKERALQFGVVLLLFLTVFVLYNDILKTLPAR